MFIAVVSNWKVLGTVCMSAKRIEASCIFIGEIPYSSEHAWTGFLSDKGVLKDVESWKGSRNTIWYFVESLKHSKTAVFSMYSQGHMTGKWSTAILSFGYSWDEERELRPRLFRGILLNSSY